MTDAPRLVPVHSPADLASCAQENIQSPGAIQPHGVLLAARCADFVITHASENLDSLFPLAAAQAIGQNLAAVLGGTAVARIAQTIAAAPPPDTHDLSLPLPGGGTGNFHLHRAGTLIIIEIEPSDDAPAAGIIDDTQSMLSKLRRAPSLSELCDQIAREIRRLTAYDRVMVYRFDPEGHGQVIAEARAPDMEPYLDLRYPASDIPPQARALYLLSPIRIIAHVGYQPVPVLAAAGMGALDMSLCQLRSVSPVHREYLANMGVGATLVISIILDRHLWGMIVCHHKTARTPTAGMRMFCDLAGQLMGLLVGETWERESLQGDIRREEHLAAIAHELDSSQAALASLSVAGAELLALVGATGAVLRIAGQICTIGAVPSTTHAAQLLDILCVKNSDEIIAIDNLSERLSESRGDRAPWQNIISGVLALPLSRHGNDAIAWFRPEIHQTVKWGGNPLEKALMEPISRRISPRRSFDLWKETVTDRSLPWHEADLRAAQRLRRLLTRTLLRQAEAELFRLSHCDPLTGLANRSVLNQHIEAWRAAVPGRPAALMFFDLDRFKTVNDSLGHFAGDDLLREAAARIAAKLAGRHLLVRLGGDEFVIFCQDIGADEAAALAEAVLRLFDTPFNVAGRPYRAAASVGLAYATDAADDLLRDADAAMYAAKRRGGNHAVRFHPNLHSSVFNRLHTEQDLFLAIDRHEIAVHYQPIVSLPDGILRGFEALARWLHPQRGWVAPAEFVPLAEETGLIHRLGHHVAAQAVQALAALADTALRMTINVSGHQLQHGDFSTAFSEILQVNAVAAGRVTIEVTESVLMADEAVRQLEHLRALGCRIAIDDFGTGYSSLAYLQRLPIDIIKIDRGFISPLGTDDESEHFLRALITFTRTLGFTLIAEGVETPAQRDLLADMCCDAAQGYLFGHPQPTCIQSVTPGF